MKKKRMLLLSALPLLAFSFASCSLGGSDEGSDFTVDESITPDESVKGNLNIRYFKRGFGDQWLYNSIKTFETKYPNVKVKATPSTEAKVIYGEIIGGIETKFDLYMTESSIMDYRENFVNINDVYASTVIDEEVSVRDKIDESYFQSCSDENGDFYTIPAYCGAFGFQYNRDFIEEENIPVTTDELLTLCKSLKSQSITPLVYSGGDDSQYLNFLYSSLAAQYEGRTPYLKAQVGRVYSKESASYKTDVSSAFLKGHEEASKVCESLYWQPNGFTSSQCVGYNANAAQVKLLDASNMTAMMFNGTWMMNEMSTIIKSYEVDVNQFGMFKTPIISSIIDKCPSIENDAELSALIHAIDKKETALKGVGYEVSQEDFARVKEARDFVYVGSEDSRFVITKKARNQDLAKLFLKFYYSNPSIKAFNAAKAGCYIPLKASSVDTTGMNAYLKDAYTILANNEKFFNLPGAFMAVTPYLYPENLTIEKAFGSANFVDRKTTAQQLQLKKEAWTNNNNAKFKDEMARHGYSLDQ